MYRGIFRNAVNISHAIIKEIVQSGDLLIDATCGNGHDTLFMAELVGNDGKVWAFDLQEKAINKSKKLLADNDLEDRVIFIKDNHINISQYLSDKVSACMFNLGYLPGGNHTLISEADTTFVAVKNVLNILKKGGVLTVVSYPGHRGGQEEHEKLYQHLSCLSQKEYEVLEMRFVNQVNYPPQLIVVQKL